MAPKKKIPGKKRTFTLQTDFENSALSKSSWQSKYQELLPEEAHSSQNGSSNAISSTTTTQLGGLVGDYSSDTDDDSKEPMDSKIDNFMKEINNMDPESVATTSQPSLANSNGTNYPAAAAASNWVQFFDEDTGYPYYWNQLTNDVTWQMPSEYAAAYNNMHPMPSHAPSAQIPKPNSPIVPTSKKSKSPAKKKYPWERNSDSEDEKIEMITSFQTPADDSDSEPKCSTTTRKKARSRSSKKVTREREGLVGPQLPPGAEENNEAYETSSLMTLLVPDEGPPGVEPSKDIPLDKQIINVPDSCVFIDSTESNGIVLECSNEDTNGVNFTNDISLVPDFSPLPGNTNDTDSMDTRMTDEKNDCELADEILAEIEKEIPPDFEEPKQSKKDIKKEPTSFALIASYGDDSEPEEVDISSDQEVTPTEIKRPCLFPSTAQPPSSPTTSKPLFPAVFSEAPIVEILESLVPCNESTVVERAAVAVASSSQNPLLDANLPDSTTTHKAFKRKKRIELAESKREPEVVPEAVVTRPIFDTSSFILSSSQLEPNAEYTPVSVSNPRYNMDPTSGEHRGFGFSTKGLPGANEKKSKGIHFVKAETLTFKLPTEPSSIASTSSSLCDNIVPAQDLLDGAALLREKLAFLGEGTDEVSVVQKMAIQLEILVTAWQSGALTPTYLCQWLGSRAVEISANEEAAAPAGWICEWERESKRYRYRNLSNGTITWEYPEEGADHLEPNGAEDVEMELSDTPPRMSPTRHDPDPEPAEMVPPPPPVISRSYTPPPPSPPKITCPPSSELVSSSSEDLNHAAPPLPPGPYPPPPPDEPPPPGVDDVDVTYQHLPISNHSYTPTPSPPDSSSQLNAELVRPSLSRLSSAASSSVAEVSTSAPNGNKRCLISELDSFYMDIAKLDSVEPEIVNDADNYAGSPLVQDLPAVVSSTPSSSSKTYQPSLVSRNSDRSSSPVPARPHQSTSSDDTSAKKRKKNKLGAGLTLKKKGVSTLVAKWQQVREEARKTYSSDEGENDDVSSSYK